MGGRRNLTYFFCVGGFWGVFGLVGGLGGGVFFFVLLGFGVGFWVGFWFVVGCGLFGVGGGGFWGVLVLSASRRAPGIKQPHPQAASGVWNTRARGADLGDGT